MTSKFENKLKIVSGPSKWDLILALFEGKKVEFTVKGKYPMMSMFRIQLNSVEAEDGFRESWNITGGIVGMIFLWSREPNPDSIEEISWRNCRIYFHTKHRTGSIQY